MSSTAVRMAKIGLGRVRPALLCLVALILPGFSWIPSAIAQSNPYNSLELIWTAPGDDGNVGQVSSYRLRYSTTPVGPDTSSWWDQVPSSQWITLGPPLASAGAADSARVNGLTQGTTYFFVLRALDEAANMSGFSNVAAGTTQSCNPPTTSPGQFNAVADTGQVQVTWAATGDPNAVSLNLYRSVGSSGPFTLLRNLSLSATSYLDQSVAPGTTYRYRAAWMGAVCEGPMTSIKTVTTPGTPAPPPPPATEGSTVRAYPNPSSGPIRLVIHVVPASPQAVDLRLYDMNGHLIAYLVGATYSSGDHEITWNRMGREGRAVAPGYYEILGTVGSERVRERVILTP